MTQPNLFDLPEEQPIPGARTPYDFDGCTYEPKRDRERLTGQLKRVYELMHDGQWRSLGDIAKQCGGTEAAVSARLRDLRKPKFGAHEVARRHVLNGLFEYRLIVLKEGQ